jgi:3-oxosteroid 1-dehydrogenase
MSWDEICDVVVIGSGVSGLAAALAARHHGFSAVVLEKAAKIGGGTAYSTGELWIPLNRLAQSEGLHDSREEAIAYMRYLGAGYELPNHMTTFIDQAHVALDYFVERGIRFQLVHRLPDHYYDKAPGSLPDGRMIEPQLLAGRELGEWQDRIETAPHLPSGVTFDEIIKWGGRGNQKNWDQATLSARQRDDMRGLGVSLAAQFLKAFVAEGGAVLLSTPAERLVLEDGHVTGVIARSNRTEKRIGARRGLVIASGGYESNPELVREYEGLTEDDWQSMFSPHLAGDGLMMGAEVGAKVHALPVNMGTFLGFRVPGRNAGDLPSYRPATVGMTSYPHTVIVNREGARFGDESYFPAIVTAARQFDAWMHRFPNMPCFVIFDQNYAEKYSFNGAPAGSPIPAWVSRAETPRDLAVALGIVPATLQVTLDRFNSNAGSGEDPEFGRGTAPWARLYAGALTHTPNPNLGPVDRPPYYGVRLRLSGASSAGLMTNTNAQVMRVRGEPIVGLYASGNAAACTDFGAGYQAGESLARGMTWSYLAIRHMASL